MVGREPIDMEIDMVARKIKADISLRGWDLPKLSNKVADVTDKAERQLQKALDDFREQFCSFEVEKIIKDTVSDFLKYCLKSCYTFDICPRKGKPGDVIVSVSFSDYDHLTINTSLRKEVKEAVRGWLEDDNYIMEEKELFFIGLAQEYRELANMIDKKIRPAKTS